MFTLLNTVQWGYSMNRGQKSWTANKTAVHKLRFLKHDKRVWHLQQANRNQWGMDTAQFQSLVAEREAFGFIWPAKVQFWLSRPHVMDQQHERLDWERRVSRWCDWSRSSSRTASGKNKPLHLCMICISPIIFRNTEQKLMLVQALSKLSSFLANSCSKLTTMRPWMFKRNWDPCWMHVKI